jgi:hypothetical protein
MPIQAIRITAKGQQAVRQLTVEVPATQKRNLPPTDEKVEKLSLRKATILVAAANGQWVTTRKLQRRLASTGEFPEWTDKVPLAVFQAKGLGDKLINELISLSEDNYVQLGREEPRKCAKCGDMFPVLYVLAEMNNETWDGSEARVQRQTKPVCADCFGITIRNEAPGLEELIGVLS